MRTTVQCQNDSDNNYRTKPTSAWALVASGMNFELLFTTEVIPPSRWVSNSHCKQGLGRNRQYPVYHTTTLLQHIQFTSRDILQRTKDAVGQHGLPSSTNLPKRRVNIYCIFLFQMGGNLECIRYCIYDSTASSFVPQSSRSFTQTQPLFFCVKSCHICSAR